MEEQNYTVREWAMHWLDVYMRYDCKPRTYDHYLSTVEKHIAPALGDYYVSELTLDRVQCFVSQLRKNGNRITGEGLSDGTVCTILAVLSACMSAAERAGIIEGNPCRLVRRPTGKTKKAQAFTVKEQHAIVKYIERVKKPKNIGILLSLYAGLRIGEVLALTWKDVDFKRSLLTVNKSVGRVRDEKRAYYTLVGKPKSASSERVIPLPPQLVSALKAVRSESKGDYVVSNQKGEAICVRTYQYSFQSMLKKLKNVRVLNYHTLRHTFATRALECGMDVKTLSELMGHSNPAITLARYAHSQYEHKRRMMNKLGRLMPQAVEFPEEEDGE
ncbi:MAG: site-specific integrase [Clostridia bacterium]|nr:site-specific integrase [Clostridia bacterium]